MLKNSKSICEKNRHIVFYGEFQEEITENAEVIGQVSCCTDEKLWTALYHNPEADTLVANVRHIDAEMMEDSFRLKILVCPREILSEADLAEISALGVAVLPMPSGGYDERWNRLFASIRSIWSQGAAGDVVNPDVYRHPAWCDTT